MSPGEVVTYLPALLPGALAVVGLALLLMGVIANTSRPVRARFGVPIDVPQMSPRDRAITFSVGACALAVGSIWLNRAILPYQDAAITNTAATPASTVAVTAVLVLADTGPATPTDMASVTMPRLSPTPAALPTAALPATTPTPTETPPTRPEFSDPFEVRLKPDWEIASGDWRVINDQLGIPGGTDSWAYLLAGDSQWRDYAVEVSAGVPEPTFSIGNCSIAILVRAQDSENSMVFSAGFAASQFSVVVGGSERVLARANGIYHGSRVRVEARGDYFAIYLDGERVLSLTDPTFASGRVGLGVVGTQHFTLDDFAVMPLAE